jgi:hypothetical protein
MRRSRIIIASFLFAHDILAQLFRLEHGLSVPGYAKNFHRGQ